MSEQSTQPFREWGILEVMGRLRLAGEISEQTIAGAGFIRIDIPATTRAPAFTRFFSPGSLYSLTPTTEQIARDLAEHLHEMPQIAAQTRLRDEVDQDEYNDDDRDDQD